MDPFLAEKDSIRLDTIKERGMVIKNRFAITGISRPNRIISLSVNGRIVKAIVAQGNNFEFKPQYSRFDANYGSVLLGNGKMDFEWQNYINSGFFIKNEIKHLKQFKDKNGKTYIIAAINNDKPKIYKIEN